RAGTGPVGSGDTSRGRSGRAPVSFFSSARLVAEREIRESVRAKGFWITFGLFVAGILAVSILPGILGGPSNVAVGGDEAARVSTAAGLEVTETADAAAAERAVRDGDVDAAIVPDTGEESPTGLRVIALSSAPTDVMAALSTPPPVDLLEPAAVSGELRYFVTFSFGLTFFMFSLMFGLGIAQSVVTEKQTRVVELLVATIPEIGRASC